MKRKESIAEQIGRYLEIAGRILISATAFLALACALVRMVLNEVKSLHRDLMEAPAKSALPSACPPRLDCTWPTLSDPIPCHPTPNPKPIPPAEGAKLRPFPDRKVNQTDD